MPEENALLPINDDLLSIFPTEDDKRGNDLLILFYHHCLSMRHSM